MEKPTINIIVFGTGFLFGNCIKHLKKEVRIVALLDNDKTKQGQTIDGIMVYDPSDIVKISYDEVLILNVLHHFEMKNQLQSYGVPWHKIIDRNRAYYYFDINETGLDISTLKYDSHLKILIFSIALNSTGANNALMRLIETLKLYSCEVIVVAEFGGELEDKLKYLNVPYIITPSACLGNSVISDVVDWSDVLFVNTFWMNDTIVEMVKARKPIVWWIHENGTLDYISYEEFDYINKIDDLRILTASPLVKTKIERYYGLSLDDVEVLSIGIEDKSQISVPFCKDTFSMACIGHIGKGKGQDLFVKAVSGLPKNIKDKSRFLIVGAGRLDEESKEMVELNECIELTGEIPYEDMSKVYNSVDAVAICSRDEGLSSVVIEASVYERPAIISNIAGIIDYMHDGYDCLVFESENVDDIRRKIVWMYEHFAEALAMGKKAKEMYRKHFSMDVFSQNVYSKIVEVNR